MVYNSNTIIDIDIFRTRKKSVDFLTSPWHERNIRVVKSVYTYLPLQLNGESSRGKREIHSNM